MADSGRTGGGGGGGGGGGRAGERQKQRGRLLEIMKTPPKLDASAVSASSSLSTQRTARDAVIDAENVEEQSEPTQQNKPDNSPGQKKKAAAPATRKRPPPKRQRDAPLSTQHSNEKESYGVTPLPTRSTASKLQRMQATANKLQRLRDQEQEKEAGEEEEEEEKEKAAEEEEEDVEKQRASKKRKQVTNVLENEMVNEKQDKSIQSRDEKPLETVKRTEERSRQGGQEYAQNKITTTPKNKAPHAQEHPVCQQEKITTSTHTTASHTPKTTEKTTSFKSPAVSGSISTTTASAVVVAVPSVCATPAVQKSIANSPALFTQRSALPDAQMLSTMNDRYRDQIAQLQSELEHAERVVQMNMGRAPVLANRACQAEVTHMIGEYEKIRQFSHAQLAKIQPSNPKYWFWEMAFHLNTEVCRIVRESVSYRGFQT